MILEKNNFRVFQKFNVNIQFNSVINDMYLGTAIPAATIARMILKGDIEKRGAFYLHECSDATLFLQNIAERGLTHEIISNEHTRGK